MSHLNTTSFHPVGTPAMTLVIVLLLWWWSRDPYDAPEPLISPEASVADQPPEPTGGLNGDSARQVSGGTVAGTTAEADGPTLPNGCFRPGSSRDEVRAVMGAPDTVDFGAWVYGQSNVTFGYGVVVDYRNEGDNLRLC